MESLDYWRLCDELSVIQAVILILGDDPTDKQYYVENNTKSRPNGYEAARAALTHAIQGGSLNATQRYSEGEYTPCWHTTTVKVDDLRQWLIGRGFNQGFFFPQHSDDNPDYLNPKHQNYSPKLAAAIGAWMAVTKSPERMKGKTAKQAIMVWLLTNAERFGLIKEDGTQNDTGIEEVAKVANWETKGGAPKTPVG